MADETQVQDFDPFEGLDFDTEGEPAEAQAEAEMNAKLDQLAENQRKIVEKIKADDEAKKIEATKDAFFKEIGEDETQQLLAHVFLDGTETLEQVERAIKLIKTKAGVAQKAAADAEDEEDDGAFAPAISGGQTPPAMTAEQELNKQLKSGTLPFRSFLDTFLKAPPGQWSAKDPD